MFVPPDTHCKTCIFEDRESFCRLNKIDFYRTKNIKIDTTDDNAVLKEFVCPYHRTKEWLSNQPVNGNLVNIIREENKLPYIAILLHLGDEIVKKTIKKLLTFTTKPKEIYVIKRASDSEKIVDEVKSLLDNTGIKWRVEFEFEENAWHNIFKFYNRTEFMLLIRGFPEIRVDWPKTLERKILDELLQFSYAENKSQTMTLISPYVYNMYYFEYTKDFLIKLRQQRHHQKCIL